MSGTQYVIEKLGQSLAAQEQALDGIAAVCARHLPPDKRQLPLVAQVQALAELAGADHGEAQQPQV